MHENDAEGPSASPADELVRRAQGYDADAEVARAELARDYKPLVVSVGAPLVQHESHRDDVIQAGYLGLFTALTRFEPARRVAFGTFARKYILGSSRRVARQPSSAWNALGDAHESRTGVNTREIDVALSADVGLENDETRRLIQAFVGNLPKRLQFVVRRVFWDGATQTEVAKELGVSKMAVSKLMADVRRRGQVELADLHNVTLAA